MGKDKDEIYFKICNAILKGEVTKGHLKWKVSEVARSAGVSRPLVYHYLGSDREQMLVESYNFMCDIVFHVNSTQKVPIKDVIKDVLAKLKSMPYLLPLFYLEKDKDSQCGEIIRRYEQETLEKLANSNPHMSKNEILRLYLLELGCGLYKTLDDEKVEELFSL